MLSAREEIMSCCEPEGKSSGAAESPKNAPQAVCCGGSQVVESTTAASSLDATAYPWIERLLETPSGTVPVVRTRLLASDRRSTWRVRWNFGRMNYAVPPGLYAVGTPDAQAPVLVTANFKLTFDRVRRQLEGRNAWLLVLDTKGINVWCAAGKGSFGTDELVGRLESTGLARVVSHRTIILPQLGAPGVASHLVTKSTKFHVVFGPVRAEDIPAFLDAGLRATPEMRRVMFPLKDRMVLTPVEFMQVAGNPIFLAVFGLWALQILGLKFIPLDGPAFLGAVVLGTMGVPALLPWIPVRPFALKGWILGLAWAIAVCVLRGISLAAPAGRLAAASIVLVYPALTAFLAMGFTGSSTFTSLSGVVKEMKYGIPAMILSGVLGLAALAARYFV
jgi:hypothetical protein